ncbi:hypothetical protein Aduo_017962 [Ancylostoma duodenale]
MKLKPYSIDASIPRLIQGSRLHVPPEQVSAWMKLCFHIPRAKKACPGRAPESLLRTSSAINIGLKLVMRYREAKPNLNMVPPAAWIMLS